VRRRPARKGPAKVGHRPPPKARTMFLFFSNKLGWLGSIAVSIVISLLLIGLFTLFF
jgi:hypothetical protein